MLRLFCSLPRLACAIGPSIVILLVANFVSKVQAQDPVTEPAPTAASVKAQIDEAGELFKKNEMTAAGEKIKAAQLSYEAMIKTGVDANQLFELRPSYSRLKKAHELLVKEGVSLEPLAELPKAANKKKIASAKENEKSGKSNATNGDEKHNEMKDSESNATKTDNVDKKSTISFTKQIAPLLARNCGQCHVQGNRGQVNFANYELLTDGQNNLIVADKPDLSKVFTAIDDEVMPPNKKLSSKDKGLLKKWIEEGAQFDGDDKSVNLGTLAGPQPRR